MASHINEIFIIGRLTRDPECRTTTGGVPVADFGLASTRAWRSKDGEEHKETCFVDITAWNHLAGLVEKFLAKGVQVFVKGSLRFDRWESKDGGGMRSKHRINLDSFQVIDFGSNNRSNMPAKVTVNEEDDQPPF